MKKLLFIVFFISMLFGDIKNINTFEASFNQTITNELDKKITYTGKVYIKKPSLALWKYNTPVTKDIFINENKVYIIEPDLEQVTISKINNNFNMIDIINSAKKINNDKYKTIIDGMDAYIFTKNGQIKKISYTDNLANDVVIEFQNTIQNIKINKDVFKVKIPYGYDIIN
jgi:outer membrane lipoprotein carrier protein